MASDRRPPLGTITALHRGSVSHGILTKVSARWRTLLETQRATWMAAAKEAKSNSRLGQSGTLSGFQLFTKINCALAQFGQTLVDAPPDRPQFPDLAAQNLVITNTAGVIALRLTCPTDPGENAIVRVNQFVDGWEDLPALPAQVTVHSGT